MPSLVALLLRVTIAYVFLLVLLRVSGKRSIKATTPFDVVVALVLGDLPDNIIWGEVPLVQGVVAIVTLVILHLAVEWATYRWQPLERWLGGVATPILTAGAVQPAAAREHLGDREIDGMLRLQGVAHRSEVRRVLLEPSGSLSVERHDDTAPATRRDLQQLGRDG
jgi:uncharacterized membrane protein YcaP (DUF421 family)